MVSLNIFMANCDANYYIVYLVINRRDTLYLLTFETPPMKLGT